MDRSKALGEDKITALLWRFSLPAITGMLVNAFYNVIDSIFVGNFVGETALAAVTIAFPIMLVLMAFGMLIGTGASTLVSIRMGEQRRDEAELILGNAFALTILVGLGFTGIILAFLDPILINLGATPDVLPAARDFTRIIIIGSSFMYIGFGLNNIVRAEGSPRTAMATMLISAILNIILNPLFILVFQLGISGSALATVVSQLVSAIWVFLYFLREKSSLKLRKSNVKLRAGIVIDIFKIGLSPFLMQIAAGAVMVLFNYNLLKYSGEMAVAAIGIINRVSMLILMPIFGISQAVQPIIGYNYGARQYGRVTNALKKAIIAATLLSTAGFVIIQIFDEAIIRLFNNNAELIQIGSAGLRVMLIMLPIIGFQVIGASYFQAVGKARQAIMLSMSRQIIMLIPLLLILPPVFGVQGIWWSGPAADFGSSLLTAVALFIELKNLQVSERHN